MIKVMAIMMAIISLMISGPKKIQRIRQVQGIGTAAVHEPACGIGEAATRVPGQDISTQGIGDAAVRVPGGD